MQNGFLDTALRVTAMAAIIIVTVCVASFGLAKFRIPAEKIADASSKSALQNGDAQTLSVENVAGRGINRGRPVGPDPLVDHLDRLGKRLEELASTVSSEWSTQTEIARLADSMQAVRQQTGLSGTRLQQELVNLRISSEVELRDLNRQIDHVSEKSQLLEREMVEQRVGILSALENQESTIASQVARLECSLDSVHSEISELRTNSRSVLASVSATRLQPLGPMNSLAPIPGNHSGDGAKSVEHDATWKEPVILDSSASVETSRPSKQRSVQTATSTGWKVSPMSHSFPQSAPQTEIAIPRLSLPLAPPAEPMPATLPPIPKTSRRANSGNIRAPLRSTLSPSSSARRIRVPEIVELPSPDEPVVKQIAATSLATDGCPAREYEIQTTVIHIAASRPIDVEPAGARMLNPELSTTTYGQPWDHDAVTHELLRKISLRTDASIAGRQQTMITSEETRQLSIGSSCPHCNEVHGFEAGDRLILSAGPACDKVQRFHVVSEVAASGNELDSMPQFDLTPMANQTYVICEEAVEGTVEETVATDGKKLVPIHGVLTPVSGPTKTRVSTQIMQRVAVMTLRDVNARPAESIVATTSASSSVKRILPPTPLALPTSEPAKKVAIKQLTRVKRHPVFLPPPAPLNALKTPRIDSNVEFVATAPMKNSRGIRQAGHQQDDDYCEICDQKRGAEAVQVIDTAESNEKKKDKSFLDWFRRVDSDSTDTDSEIRNADFQVKEVATEVSKPVSSSRKTQRRFVTKPGNRRLVR
ncbi:MAG: hypothetical protein ACKVHE_02595 [Planctomycetales bacterium]